MSKKSGIKNFENSENLIVKCVILGANFNFNLSKPNDIYIYIYVVPQP